MTNELSNRARTMTEVPVTGPGSTGTEVPRGRLNSLEVSKINPNTKEGFLSPKAEKILGIVLIVAAILLSVLPMLGQISFLVALIPLLEFTAAVKIGFGVGSTAIWLAGGYLYNAGRRRELENRILNANNDPIKIFKHLVQYTDIRIDFHKKHHSHPSQPHLV